MCDFINYIDNYDDKIIVSQWGDLHTLKDFRRIECAISRNNNYEVYMKYIDGEIILLYRDELNLCLEYLKSIRDDMNAGKLICGQIDKDN